MKNILLVDDHMVIRTGLKALLLDYYIQLNIWEASDGDETMCVLKHHKIDLILLDLQIPNTDTIGLIELISIKYPHIHILVFSMLPERIYARRILKAGASGYLPKDSSPDEMKKAFDLALRNKKYLSPNLQNLFASHEEGTNTSSPFDKLSHREFEIITLLLAGRNMAAIAQTLNIKPSTVGTYKTRIFEKLQVETVFELKEMATLYNFKSGHYATPAGTE